MYLETINNYSDLKKINIKNLPILCNEIREYLIENVLKTGGHLSSNLGIVELTVALHYVFNEDDKFIWDVGHQSYVHKLLTGRRDIFNTLRQKNGISGFVNPTESDMDTFVSGHSSTAVSLADATATARDLNGESFDVIGILGDGALTGGLTYEGLNNLDKRKMLLVLNDNEMSIAKNVGSITANLSKLRVGKNYLRFKRGVKSFFNHIPLIGKPIVSGCRAVKRSLKFMFLNNLFFENFDLKYVGPINGHNITDLVSVLKDIKKDFANKKVLSKPTLLHILTTKGKGYSLAEKEPEAYHSVSGYSDTPENFDKSYSGIVGQSLCNLANTDSKIVAITAAMPTSTGLNEFSKLFPDRFFDVGIAEEHAVTFAGGLAKFGIKPYFAVYSTFLQRSYDEIIENIAIENLNVTLLIDRAGFVGQDGETHQGLFDISYLASIPNLTLLSPKDGNELNSMINWTAKNKGLKAIRYNKGCDEISFAKTEYEPKWETLNDGKDLLILANGNRMLSIAIKVVELLKKKRINAKLANASVICPIDSEYLYNNHAKLVVTIEENVLNGGFGSLVNNFFAVSNTKTLNFGVKNIFVKHATVSQQIEDNGLDAKSIFDKILKELKS